MYSVCKCVCGELRDVESQSHCEYMYEDCVAYFVDTVTTYNTYSTPHSHVHVPSIGKGPIRPLYINILRFLYERIPEGALYKMTQSVFM